MTWTADLFPFQFLVASLCGWLRHEQDNAIAFLREENRVLKAQLEARRPRFNDIERRGLAELGHRLGRSVFGQVATLATPDSQTCTSADPTMPPHSHDFWCMY